jgi:hypothetical protein
MPIAISRLLSRSTLDKQVNSDPERFDALERAGFKTDRYGDLMWNLYERSGGHYLDVGTSAKIANGLVYYYYYPYYHF